MDNVNDSMQELVNTILEVRYSDLALDFECCQKLLVESENNHSVWGTAFAYTYLGDYYIAQNDTIQIGKYLLWAKELCIKHSFRELHMQVCHFTGIYYIMIYDEQTALQYYMDALELARGFEDIKLECIILNNIADIFQCRGDYDEAGRYFFQALDILSSAHCSQIERHKVLVLYSLTELFLYLKDLPMAEKYLRLCAEVTTVSKNDKEYQDLVVCCNQCCIAALQSDHKHALIYAERLLVECIEFEDKYVVIGVLFPAIKVMIELGEAGISWRLLLELSQHCTLHETFNIQKLMGLRILYHNTFSRERERNRAYQDFYDTLCTAMEIENQVRTSGMKAKIHLWEMIKEQEAMIQENKRLESAVHLDELTGIYNRRYVNKLCSKLESAVGTKHMCVIMLDVDYFKEYNDYYGHTQGDGALIAVASALSKFKDDEIWPGRYGGDEFICICLNKKDREIEAYIENVRNHMSALAMPHVKSHCKPIVTLSIGYSNMVIDEQFNIDTLIELADQALYSSKNRGRNQWSRSG